jgi:hypothetical protein
VDIFQALEQAKAADIRRRAEQRKAFAARQRLESQAKLQAQKLKRLKKFFFNSHILG